MIADVFGTGSVAAGLIVLVGLLLFYVGRNWLTAKVEEAVRLGANKELAEYSHDLRVEENALREELSRVSTQLQAIQGMANSAFIEGQRAAAEWRVKAADEAWAEVLILGNSLPLSVQMMDTFSPEEYESYIGSSDREEQIDEIQEVLKGIATRDIGRIRPFTGDKIFALITIYRSIISSVCVVAQECFRRSEFIKWFEEKRVVQALALAVSPNELEEFLNQDYGKLLWIEVHLERAILDEIRALISGEVSSSERIEQGRRIYEAVQQLELAEDSPSRSG